MTILDAIPGWIFRRTRSARRRVLLTAQIALVKNSSLLLVRHRDREGWHLPGDHVAPPELPEHAAVRGLSNGTGYRLTDDPELVGVFPDASACATAGYLAVFASINFNSDIARQGGKIAEMRWFSLRDLPSDVSAVCRKVAHVLID